MAQQEIVVGLDIGTTKVCTVIGQSDARGDVNVIGVGVMPSRGLKKGAVVDVESTIAAITDSVERARHMADVPVTRVVAGITGDHIQSYNKRGTVTVAATRGIVSRGDVERAMQAASLEVPRERELIHSLSREFVLDGQRGIRRPVGMTGQRLEVETHIVTGSANALATVASCVARAGLQVEALVLEPIATAEAVLTADERELGVVLIDVGGGTSDIAVFHNGSILYSAVLTVGGNHVTRDIAIGLRTPFDIAERLKIERGAATTGMIPHGEALEVVMAGSGERLRIPRALLGDIIEARMTELFDMARQLILQSGVVGSLPGGIVLSGGGALLPGVLELAQKIFELPVRLGRPMGLIGWSDQVANPQFATGVGLCRFAVRGRRSALDPGDINGLSVAQGRKVWGALLPPASEAPPAEETSEPEPPVPSQPVVEPAPLPPVAVAPVPIAQAVPVVPQPAVTDEPPTPWDRMGRRAEMLEGVEEPSWKKFIARVRQFFGFESDD